MTYQAPRGAQVAARRVSGVGQAEEADRPALDRHRFDELLAGPEKIWGVKAIAKAIAVSESTVRRWAKEDVVPIYRPAGSNSYFAFRSELQAWLRCKA